MKVIQLATATLPASEEDEASIVLFALTDDGKMFILREADNDWPGSWERVPPISVNGEVEA